MKQTSLYEQHKAAGAAMVPFAGWDMPVSYKGTVGEVQAVREQAGLFDVSHMGEARVTGPEALSFIQFVTTNDASKLEPGKAQYSLLLDVSGGIIDDIIVYCWASDDYLIVLNAGCKDKDWDWLQSQAQGFPGITLTDESDQTALLAVQGPAAVEAVTMLANDRALSLLKRFSFTAGSIGKTKCTLSRTGYTGEDGFEIFCSWNDAPHLWDLFAEVGVQPAGLGARDVLRLEAAYPLYGHELDAEHNPWESGVGWAVKPKKGTFVGLDALLKTQAMGIMQKLAGLKMEARAIPREHYPVLNERQEVIGEITSGTFSPTVKAGIAMVRLARDWSAPDTPVFVDIRGRQAAAAITALPFYRNGV